MDISWVLNICIFMMFCYYKSCENERELNELKETKKQE